VRKTKETLAAVSEARYPTAVAQALAAAESAPEPERAGVEAVVVLAELDPEGARTALWRLQSDWATLQRLEEHVGGEPDLATLRVGAAIHLARSELASPAPQLRERLPELMEWLGRSATDEQGRGGR
jgi:hypothetical protein